MGANKLLRSMNQGKDFKEISEDLTQGSREGDVAFGTITTIDESKMKFGLIYVGTDDGNIHVTKDGDIFGIKYQMVCLKGFGCLACRHQHMMKGLYMLPSMVIEMIILKLMFI